MAKGFFSPTTWIKQQAPPSLLPDCKKCGLLNHCLSPKMPVTGQGRKKVLIIAEAPGENEDRRNKQLIGNAGMELVRILHGIGINMRKDAFLTNALICRPWDSNGNRKPTDREIGFCRPNLRKTLLDLQPDVIIPLGEVAVKSLMPLAWKDGEVSDIGTWVGWKIPCIKLNSWICPTYHPSFLSRTHDPVLERMMTEHLQAAFALEGKPWGEKPDWLQNVRAIQDPNEAINRLCMMIEGAQVDRQGLAFDYETDRLKPDHPDSQILCCSVSNGLDSIAFPWSAGPAEIMSKFLRSDIPKIGANLQFEERWTRKVLGHGVKNWLGGGDVVVKAHWADCRHGITSVKFQSFVRFGTEDYDSWLDPYKKSKDSNTPNRLKEVDIQDLLLYCGLDSLFEYMLLEE